MALTNGIGKYTIGTHSGQKQGHAGKDACQKDACGSKGGSKCGGGLLDRLFGCNRCATKGGKGDKGGKGCCDKDPTPTEAQKDTAEDAPMPPAPVVDPSAFLNTRRVIPVTHIVR